MQTERVTGQREYQLGKTEPIWNIRVVRTGLVPICEVVVFGSQRLPRAQALAVSLAVPRSLDISDGVHNWPGPTRRKRVR
jgi:hypothetical protein